MFVHLNTTCSIYQYILFHLSTGNLNKILIQPKNVNKQEIVTYNIFFVIVSLMLPGSKFRFFFTTELTF